MSSGFITYSTAPDIARQLTAEFDVSDTQAGDDVTDALLQLKEAGLVGGVRYALWQSKPHRVRDRTQRSR